jgi:phospho-N-acetylmuramoyl-pentapeptide-transferase
LLLSLTQLLMSWYPEELGFLRVFQYLTFRAVLAAVTSMLFGLALGPWVIRRLTEMKIGQPIREYGMASHLGKRGTPTMGGVLVLIGIGVSTILWFDWTNRFVWVVMLVTFGFGAIGWIDDWRKVVHKDPEGMRSREKFFWQTVIALVAATYLAFSVAETSNVRVLELFLRWVNSGFSTALPPRADLMVPFVKTYSYPLGVWGFIAMSWTAWRSCRWCWWVRRWASSPTWWATSTSRATCSFPTSRARASC